MRALSLVLFVSLALTACAQPYPTKPERPVPVFSSRSRIRLSWEGVNQLATPSIVSLTVEHDTFESFPNYLEKMGRRSLLFLLNPIRELPDYIWLLFTGYLDLDIVEGTGFIISKQGHVLTNAHVVQGGDKVVARMSDGSGYRKVDILAISVPHDLALLKLQSNGAEGFDQPLQFRDTRGLGEDVAILGYPSRPWAKNNPLTLTAGTVSSEGLDIGEAAKRFQTDAASNAGASGSPALGRDGAALGIVAEHSKPALLEDQTFVIPSRDIEAAGFIKRVPQSIRQPSAKPPQRQR